ncbi:MAG: KH domain-containing protein [Oscillospiraceae bacterium]|jgi:spoIIIJ-associated protein|nr:KH domain-containing protein [Oscillospiraceae bacterium]
MAEDTYKEEYIRNTTNLVEVAYDYLVEIIKGFGFDNLLVERKFLEDGVEFNIQGENIGVVIGKHGGVLDSIQYLTNLVANQRGNGYFRVKINACEYREKRERALMALGEKVALKVERTLKPYKLEPMSAYDRRLIHLAIKDFSKITSFSEGDGLNRHVVILPIYNEENS